MLFLFQIFFLFSLGTVTSTTRSTRDIIIARFPSVIPRNAPILTHIGTLQKKYTEEFWTLIPKGIPKELHPYLIAPEQVTVAYNQISGKENHGTHYIGRIEGLDMDMDVKSATSSNSMSSKRLSKAAKKATENGITTAIPSSANMELLNEALIMSALDDPNILPLGGITWVIEKNNPTILLLTPYIGTNTLKQYAKIIRKNRLPINEPLTGYEYFQQISHAVEYSHTKGFAHTKLTGKSIIVYDTKNVIVRDFSSAQMINPALGNADPFVLKDIRQLMQLVIDYDLFQQYNKQFQKSALRFIQQCVKSKQPFNNGFNCELKNIRATIQTLRDAYPKRKRPILPILAITTENLMDSVMNNSE